MNLPFLLTHYENITEYAEIRDKSMLYASTLFTDKFLTNFSETRHEIIPPFHETDTLSYKTPLSKRLVKM